MSSTCIYCQQPVEFNATRCPHCTSRLSWGGLHHPDDLPRVDYSQADGNAFLFALSVGLFTWGLFDHHWISWTIAAIWVLLIIRFFVKD